ncbi:MAG: T9SS type A sorting domain-containing protein [Bacteroidetes bacterium]|nr:T9SS type A sorting domain-containing protein [Bacteroidota bacterium]
MMTKRILGLIFLFSALFAAKTIEAQTYRPILQDSVRWIVVWDDISTPFSDDDRWEYFAQGDTLVENILYKKIYHRFLESKYGKQPPFQAVSPYVLFGLMREDTLTHQVFGIRLDTEVHYYSGCPSGMEALMYDFSLNVGDTINHFCTIPEGCGEVNIYSTGQSNVFGIYTRWFEVAGDCSWGRLYEGIGSSYGLWESMFTPVKSFYVWNLRLEYYCPDAVCPFIVGTKELEANDRSLKVYPNPANDKITIEISDTQSPVEMMIYDTKGLCHKSQQFDQSGNGTFQVDISSLPLGIYLLQIQTKSTTYTQKIIKANRATAY